MWLVAMYGEDRCTINVVENDGTICFAIYLCFFSLHALFFRDTVSLGGLCFLCVLSRKNSCEILQDSDKWN